jgi:regulator of sirC expression with transglutaminase-like and TPR domain
VTGTDETLAAENAAVLMVVQAMAGLIGPGWEAVTVEVGPGILLLRIWVDDPVAMQDDVNELVADVEGLAAEVGRRVRHEVTRELPRPYDRARHGRIVFLRRYDPPIGC